MAASTNAPGLADIDRHIYAASGDALAAFLLWLATSGMIASVDPRRIVLMQSVSHFVSRLGRPAAKWDSKAFSATGSVRPAQSPWKIGNQVI